LPRLFAIILRFGSGHHPFGDLFGLAANGPFQTVGHFGIFLEEGLSVLAALADANRLEVAVGTGEVVGAVDPRPIIDSAALVETNVYPAGGYFLKNPGWLSGGGVAWLCGLAGFENVQTFDVEAASVPPGADGVTFLPALTGAFAPEWHAGARGCFYGLTPSHGRGHLARALLEGCAFAMRDVAERLRILCVEMRDVLLLGGAARSALWTQMRIDLLGLPGRVASRVDTAPVGAAMLAAVAAGLLPDLATAGALAAAEPARKLEPDRRLAAVYEDAYGRYRRLFDALRPLFDTEGRAG
jgi:xylulokinase